jgi:TonB family protein
MKRALSLLLCALGLMMLFAPTGLASVRTVTLAVESAASSAQLSPEVASYLERVRARVASYWRQNRPRYQADAQLTVALSLERSGALRDLQLLNPGPDVMQNQAALTAVRKAAPYGPLPVSATDECLRIRLELRETLLRATPKIMDKQADLDAYRQQLLALAKQRWQPPEPAAAAPAVIEIRVSLEGRLKTCRLLLSSGSVEADQAALNAVFNASTGFPPPPEKLRALWGRQWREFQLYFP